jgi:hypothetical protein
MIRAGLFGVVVRASSIFANNTLAEFGGSDTKYTKSIDINMNKTRAELRISPQANGLNEKPASDQPAWLNLVSEKVKGLNFGVVQIVVHDSRVVQVERTERHRFDVQNAP